MEDKLWLSALKLLPGTLTVALALTPLGSRVGKGEESAAVNSTALQLPEPLFLSTTETGFTRTQPSLVPTSGAAELLFPSLQPFLDSQLIQEGT